MKNPAEHGDLGEPTTRNPASAPGQTADLLLAAGSKPRAPNATLTRPPVAPWGLRTFWPDHGRLSRLGWLSVAREDRTHPARPKGHQIQGGRRSNAMTRKLSVPNSTRGERRTPPRATNFPGRSPSATERIANRYSSLAEPRSAQDLAFRSASRPKQQARRPWPPRCRLTGEGEPRRSGRRAGRPSGPGSRRDQRASDRRPAPDPGSWPGSARTPAPARAVGHWPGRARPAH